MSTEKEKFAGLVEIRDRIAQDYSSKILKELRKREPDVDKVKHFKEQRLWFTDFVSRGRRRLRGWK